MIFNYNFFSVQWFLSRTQFILHKSKVTLDKLLTVLSILNYVTYYSLKFTGTCIADLIQTNNTKCEYEKPTIAIDSKATTTEFYSRTQMSLHQIHLKHIENSSLHSSNKTRRSKILELETNFLSSLDVIKTYFKIWCSIENSLLNYE